MNTDTLQLNFLAEAALSQLLFAEREHQMFSVLVGK